MASGLSEAEICYGCDCDKSVERVERCMRERGYTVERCSDETSRDWRPIETAPKDGQYILVKMPEWRSGPPARVTCWKDCASPGWDSIYSPAPVAWAPLPGSPQKAPETTASPQAPIARIKIKADRCYAVELYAPGLPPGEHDLYCEPEAVAPMMRDKRAYYETHDPPHCPTCGCGMPSEKASGGYCTCGKVALAKGQLGRYYCKTCGKDLDPGNYSEDGK